jgi:hypothetical protein
LDRLERQRLLDLDAKKKKDAYNAMVKREEQKVGNILRQREEKEKTIVRVRTKEAEDNLQKAEMARQKQLENEYTQNRRQRMEEYRRQKILERIEQDNRRAKDVEDQKSQILRQREKFRVDGLMQKHQIMETFEKMKVTKKFDKMNAELSKIGGDTSMFQSNQLALSVGPSGGGGRAQSAGFTRSENNQSQPKPEKKRRPKRPFSADARRGGPPQTSPTANTQQSQTARGAGSPKRKSKQAFADATKPETDPSTSQNARGGDGGESPQSRRQVVQKQVNNNGRPQASSNRPGKLRAQTAKSKGKGAGSTQGNDFGKKAAALDMLRRKQNEKLLMVLEEEQKAEEEREKKMREVRETGERQRLDKIFGVERARASDRIMKLTEEHERFLPSSFPSFIRSFCSSFRPSVRPSPPLAFPSPPSSFLPSFLFFIPSFFPPLLPPFLAIKAFVFRILPPAPHFFPRTLLKQLYHSPHSLDRAAALILRRFLPSFLCVFLSSFLPLIFLPFFIFTERFKIKWRSFRCRKMVASFLAQLPTHMGRKGTLLYIIKHWSRRCVPFFCMC